MKRRQVGRAALLALALMSAAVAWASPREASAQARTVVVDIDGAIFEEPDEGSRLVLRVRAGEQLQVVSEAGGWLRVQLPRGTGWILARTTRAQGGRSGLAGQGAGGASQVTIVDSYADVKAGPGDAYLAVKRVFKGDSFEQVQVSEDRSWVQIKVGSDLGWVRADQTLRADAVYKAPSEVVGSGTSAGPAPLEVGGGDPELESLIEERSGGGGGGGESRRGEGATSLRLRVGGLAQSTSQSFESNLMQGMLSGYETGSTGFGADVGVEYFFIDWVGVAASYSFGFGLPIQAEFEEASAELKNSTQRVHGRVIGRYPITPGPNPTWVGASVGGIYQLFDIQTTSVPLFTANTYTGLRVGLDGGVGLGAANLWASGWYVLGGIDQGGLATGAESEVTAFGAEVGAEVEVTEGFGIFGRVLYDRAKATFTGASMRDAGITEAVNRDQFITLGLGVLWRPL